MGSEMCIRDREQAKLGAPGTSVLAVAEPSDKEELPEKSEIEKLTEQMTEMVAAVKGTNQRLQL